MAVALTKGQPLREIPVSVAMAKELLPCPPDAARVEAEEPFEQRGADRTGLGLGLSISLKGVRASGGEIHVRDLPGLGCMFTVDLPRAPPAP